MDDIIIACDLGGTNFRLAAVTAKGEIVFRTKRRTPKSEQTDEILQTIIECIDECRYFVENKFKIKMVAAAVPATVDTKNGVIMKAPNVPCFDGFGLSATLSERTGISVILENDANAAAAGESWLGASRGFENSICVTLGTGVGGGIIINGRILRGSCGTAGEIGHICVEPFGVSCGCGSRGCVEQYGSATAVVRLASELGEDFPNSILLSNRHISAQSIYEAGEQGDELALEIFRRQGFYLGIALANLINVLNPEVIVIGGGAAGGWNLFVPSLLDEIKKRAYREPAELVKIVRAECGDDAGILGVAKLAFSKVENFL